MRKRKSENELVRFVWSRNMDYDYFLLLEVQARNPYSFKKPKPVWKPDIAKTLQECELKMKVTDRSCRERVDELLKKHRKEEGLIIRSTGATADKLTAIKKLLIIINEMALTEPDELQSSVYQLKNKKDGEDIRDAALNEISDTDSDDYINSYISGKSRENSQDDEKIVYTDIRDNPDEMTFAEEIAYAEKSMRSKEKVQASNMPSTSRDNRYSVPEASPEADFQSANVDEVNGDSLRSERQSTQGSSMSTLSKHKGKTSAKTNKKCSNSKDTASDTSNDRFSNPKKDLIKYLERKSENDIDVRKEEIRIREMEVMIKRDEVEILRLKTDSEREERKRNSELEAQNKKEELQILRLKTEAEIEERKKTQELLIALLTKNN